MGNRIRVLAVEDDPLHEEKLRMTMDQLGYVLIDVLTHPKEVVNVVEGTAPDLLLMDIDLNSDISGIELVATINERFDIPSIFLTSFVDIDTFNLAKEVSPEAYLAKPYSKEELQRSIELAVFKHQKKRNAPVAKPMQPTRFLFVKDENSLVKLYCKDIEMVEAYDKYCYVSTRQKRFMIKERLKNIQNCLSDDTFIQVHRSFVVNFESIETIKPDLTTLTVAGKEVRIGRKFKENLMTRIHTLG